MGQEQQEHKEPFWVKTKDYHTAGEPFRIVPTLPSHCLPQSSTTIQSLRQQIMSTPQHPLDLLRRSLCHEPRGHADMYGCFILPPNDPGAHFGVLFWHKDGFSTACGHGTIALGTWAVEQGIVEGVDEEGEVEVVVDVPSGRVAANVHVRDNQVRHVDFVNVASYQFGGEVPVTLDVDGGERKVRVDLAWGGATSVCVDASELGLKVEVGNHLRFIELGRKVKVALGKTGHHEDTSIYSVIFFEHLDEDAETLTQRNVVVFADGQIDRSPCGSGTCARVAVLLAQGRLRKGMRLVHESIIGTRFESWILDGREQEMKGRFPVCWPVVRGIAKRTGKCEFLVDPRDEIYPGFVFR